MLRSFLAPRHPRTLLSRRHERRRLGRSADAIPSRSYISSEDETTATDADRAAAKPVAATSANRHGSTSPKHRRQHLYLILDDWKKGFSIHKLDLLGDGSDGGDLALRPPVHRQSSEQINYWSFAALGSNIIATGKLRYYREKDCVTLVYDTETAGLSILPDIPKTLRAHWLHTAAAGNKLYTFAGNLDGNESYYKGCMHRLEDAPPPMDTAAYRWGNNDHWSWSSIPWTLPFDVFQVQSIAVHPAERGHTQFVSVEGGQDSDPLGQDNPSCTYSYDIESGKWRGHGKWGLSFFGQVHFDKELAWVGLHKAHEYTDGYICSCDVISPTDSHTKPAWKLCKEMMFDPDATMRLDMDRHIPASLVYMGDSSYCLVEVVPQERFNKRHCTSTGSKCMIRLFTLKYGKNGELRTTAHKPNRSFLFSKYNEDFQVRAFWM
ncbi:hypothetical protein VPH35_004681 [Triticum aestivum]